MQDARSHLNEKKSLRLAHIEGMDIDRVWESYLCDGEVLYEVLDSSAHNLKWGIEQLLAVSRRWGKYGHRRGSAPCVFVDFDFDGYRAVARGIKTACYGVYADSMGRVAEGLEYAAKDHNIGYIIERNAVLVMELMVLHDRLRETLSAADCELEKPKRDIPDEKALARLIDACALYDRDVVYATIVEIECYEYVDNRAAELVARLRDSADKSNFAGITDVVTKLFAA